MKIFGTGLAAHLGQDSTTLCYCWRIERVDGAVQGFTDHDRDLFLVGTSFLATTGITTTKMVQKLGLSVDNLELEGAIDDDEIRAIDIENGLYDNAKVDLYVVNWNDVTQYSRIARGTFGNVAQVEDGFQVEFRSRAHVLNQPTGRVYQRSCDAKLGDTRCKFPVVPVVVTVTGVTGHTVTMAAISQANDWFSLGVLVTADGARYAIKEHSGLKITLWERPVVSPVIGSSVTLLPGCRQDLATCRDKFNNVANFRGFPFIPGNDALVDYPIRGKDDYDGGSLFRDL